MGRKRDILIMQGLLAAFGIVFSTQLPPARPIGYCWACRFS